MSPDPFHPGERLVQERSGFRMPGAPIRDFMPDQHRLFFASLPVLFMGVEDACGAPVATALSGPAGFIGSPDPTHLAIAAVPGAGDPAAEAMREGAHLGLLGLDFQSRRRNRANGVITHLDGDGLVAEVLQSFGNCPKYINPRQPETGGAAGPMVAVDGLDAAMRDLIAGADTFFVATSSGPGGGSEGGIDMSHRGGPAGFVQVDGDRLTIPDFRGNRYFNTFGNLVLDDRVALLFIGFPTGGLLQLQGRATIEWGEGGVRSWSVAVTRAVWRPGALGVRWNS